MVTLSADQLDHAIRVIALLCVVMGMVGALALDVLMALLQRLVSGITYVIDRRARVDMSRKRAASFRRVGERFVHAADRMEGRILSRIGPSASDQPGPDRG